VIARTPALNWLDMLGRRSAVPSPGGTHQPPGPPALTGSRRRIRLACGVPRNHGDPTRLPGSLEAALAGARFASRATARIFPGAMDQPPGPPARAGRLTARSYARWRSLRLAMPLAVAQTIPLSQGAGTSRPPLDIPHGEPGTPAFTPPIPALRE
jgi:hypothetical protein